MAYTFVQGAVGSGGGVSSLSVPFSANVAAGDLLIAAVNDSNQTPSLSDTRGNTWTLVDPLPTNPYGLGVGIYYAISNGAGACTVKDTSTSGSYIGMVIAQFHDSAGGTWSLDGALHGTNTGSGTAVSAGTFTPTAGDLLIATQGNDVTPTQTPGTGWTDGPTHQLNNANGNASNSGEYQLSASGSSVSAAFTISSGHWAAAYAAFKTGGAGPVDPFPAGYSFPRPLITQYF